MTLRVPKAALPAGLGEAMIEQLGAVPEPARAMYNAPAVATAVLELSAKANAWDAAPAGLKTADGFTPLEREVLAYAEAMSDTPSTVSDAQSASLLAQLGPAALVELTVYIAFANLSARANAAHGITSQGYSDSCAIPLAHAS